MSSSIYQVGSSSSKLFTSYYEEQAEKGFSWEDSRVLFDRELQTKLGYLLSASPISDSPSSFQRLNSYLDETGSVICSEEGQITFLICQMGHDENPSKIMLKISSKTDVFLVFELM